MTRPIILGIESATSRVGCAIGSRDGVLAARESARPRRHAESLVPQIVEILEESGVSTADIEVIAVDIGPGLYTGLRVGITTAITMAHVLDAAMVPVTSLELVAHGVGRVDDTDPDSGRWERIDAVVDARRGELFHAAFKPSFDWISEPRVVDPQTLAETLCSTTARTILVGDGVQAHSDVFVQGSFNTTASPVHPSAETIVDLAAVAVEADKLVGPESIRPLYLRGPDAEPIGRTA